MTSEASRRYERFVDPQLAARASARAVDLLTKHANAVVATPLADSFPSPAPARRLTLRTARCNAVLGLKIPAATQAASLQRLGMQVEAESDAEIEAAIPEGMKCESVLLSACTYRHSERERPRTVPVPRSARWRPAQARMFA